MIRGARQLVTLRGLRRPRLGAELNDLGVITDGALLIRNGLIVEVGTSRRLENLAAARDAREISAAGRVVMPGFVDSHTHLLFPAPGPTPASHEDAVRLLLATSSRRIEGRVRGYLNAMARHGTTTVEMKTGCGVSEGGELKLLRSAAVLRKGPIDVVPTFLLRLRKGAAELDTVIREFLPKIKRRNLARFADVEWGCDAECQDRFPEYLRQAGQLGFGCKVHATGPCARAAVVAAIEQFAASIDHLQYAGVTEAKLLSGCSTVATLMPAASFLAGGPDAPARALIDAGAAVALATDFNPHHSPSLSMQAVIALARVRLRMTAEEAITAATINGAYALGCADRVGSLEKDKQADVLILTAPDYRDLARGLGQNLVHVAIKRGELLYREGDVPPKVPGE